MRFVADCYRAHHPRWSSLPLSGEGAAIYGGRFNPKGVPALYLARTIDGAVAEAAQGFAYKMEPLTICLYEVDCENVADLTTASERAAHGISEDDLAAPWLLDVVQGREPASWRVSRALIASGYAGILVPSFAGSAKRDAVNVVLWRWGPDLPHRIAVHDPSGRLPADQLSWNG